MQVQVQVQADVGESDSWSIFWCSEKQHGVSSETVSKFKLNNILTENLVKNVHSEKSDRSFEVLIIFLLLLCYFNVDCISQTSNLLILDSFRYSPKFSL